MITSASASTAAAKRSSRVRASTSKPRSAVCSRSRYAGAVMGLFYGVPSIDSELREIQRQIAASPGDRALRLRAASLLVRAGRKAETFRVLDIRLEDLAERWAF